MQIRDPARLGRESNSQSVNQNDILEARRWRERAEETGRRRGDPIRGPIPVWRADDDEEEEEEEAETSLQPLSEEEKKFKVITDKHREIYAHFKSKPSYKNGSLEDCFKDSEGNHSRADFEDFVKQHRVYFDAVGENQENSLHYLAKQGKGRPLVRWLHGEWPGLALQKDADGNTPLYLAISRRQKWFVLVMLEAQHSLIEMLAAVGENGNTVHRMLQEMLPVTPYLTSALKTSLDNALTTDADSLFGDVFRCKDNEGQTPLHVAASLISQLTIPSIDDIKALLNFLRDVVAIEPSTLREFNRDGRTPLHIAIGTIGDTQFRRAAPRTALLLSWICEIIQLSPDAFLVNTATRQSPYHLLGSAKNDKECEPLVEEMKRLYIRTLPNEELKSLLYSQWDCETASARFLSQSEKRVYFDLSMTLETNLTYEYFEALSKHVRFETILHHVDLPNMSVQKGDNWFKGAPDLEERFKAIRDLTGVGRADLAKVFMWLRNNGVRKILEIHAVDSSGTSHCDEAIELSIQGFDVEVLNWERVDISSDVFANSAPDVRELHLYASGNNEVLRGWSSKDGLPRLKKVSLLSRYTKVPLLTKLH